MIPIYPLVKKNLGDFAQSSTYKQFDRFKKGFVFNKCSDHRIRKRRRSLPFHLLPWLGGEVVRNYSDFVEGGNSILATEFASCHYLYKKLV